LSTLNKKRIIAGLLALSSVLAGWLLLTLESDTDQSLRHFSTVDSLLQAHFEQFNLPEKHITQVHHDVDSGFVRKEYHIKVSPTFSQTQFHATLHRRLYPYDVGTPASVDPGNQSMSIYLYYEQAIIRSLHLRMDPSLVRKRSPASIMVVFDQPPSTEELEQLISFGEPIPLVFRVQTALEAKQLLNAYSDRYNHLAFWFTDQDRSNLLHPETRPSDLQPLKRLGKISPRAQVVSFLSDSAATTELGNSLRKTPLQYISAARALRINFDEEQHGSFNRILEKFEREAQRQRHPVLLLRNSGTLLEKTHQAILQFKQRGLTILPPPHQDFRSVDK